MAINVQKLNNDLLDANIPMDGVSDLDGTIEGVTIQFTPAATQQDRDDAAAILAAHDPTDYEGQRQTATRVQFKALNKGLDDVSVEDRAYAITARIMAYKDGANNATILAITSKATAQSYVTGKPEWTAANAATRNLVADVLETMAGIVQVALLIIE